MKAFFCRALALASAAALAGCASGGGGRGDAQAGMQIYRSHLGQQIARSPIAVEAFEPADANSPEFRSYASAVAQQLARLGWTVVNTVGQSEQVALVDVTQGTPSRMRVGAGQGGGGDPAAVATALEVRIKRRSDGTVFWEGRAVSEAGQGGSAGQRTASVERLSAELFRDFPGESGRTIRAR